MDKRGITTIAIVGGLLAGIGWSAGIPAMIKSSKLERQLDKTVKERDYFEGKYEHADSTRVDHARRINRQVASLKQAYADRDEAENKLNRTISYYMAEELDFKNDALIAQNTIDSLTNVGVEKDSTIANLEQSLTNKTAAYEEAAEQRDAYFLLTEQLGEENLELQESLEKTQEWLNVYALNKCIAPVKEKHVRRNYLPYDIKIIPSTKEAFKEMKALNKEYKNKQ